MGIKKYIIASLILIIAIAGYVFSIESGDYRIEILDKAFILPIAVWIIAPAIALFIATLVHMIFYSLRNFLVARGIQKDSENLISLINKRLLGETPTQTFKNKEIKEIGDILKQIDFKITNTDFTTTNKDIQETAGQIININGGKYISDKDLRLSNKNIIMEQNIKNKIDIDDNFALEIIKKPNSYSQDIVSAAFIKALTTKSMTTIKKLLSDINLDSNMFKALIQKDSKEDSQFALDNEALLNMIVKIDLTSSDLIEVIKAYKESFSPERLMKLFEDLLTYDEKYTQCYLYVLSEYEMIDDMREILINSQKDEYAVYKAYLDLRDAGKHYPLDTFL
ncbi:MAG: hypothetical protein KAQ94_06270 [Arcobacteraceae bacterium]|nr:hypothetical protein [Arcobacteraceae bacterium]